MKKKNQDSSYSGRDKDKICIAGDDDPGVDRPKYMSLFIFTSRT